MKPTQKFASLLLLIFAFCLWPYYARAIPYASGITNLVLNGSNYVQFVMNEGGANVGVVFEDSSSNLISANLPRGKTNFFLGSHTSYQLICTKMGNGKPAQISVDATDFAASGWGAARGLDVVKNPKSGEMFGRIFVGNSSDTNGPIFSQRGLYAFNADFSDSYLGRGTNASAHSMWVTNATDSPWKMTVAPDATLYVCDYSFAGATVWQLDPNLSSSNLVLGPVGEEQGIAAGVHGDPTGLFVTGSVAAGSLKLWDFDPALGAPASAVLGSGWLGPTQPGEWNNLFRYDIGAGPLPWTNPPVFAVTLGHSSIQDTYLGDVTIGADPTKLIGLFTRYVLDAPCIQVFDINSGDILYASQQITYGPDPFQAAYGGVQVSPDGLFLATLDISNNFIVCTLTNGIPDNSTVFRISTGLAPNSRGLAFDAADNLYMISSGSKIMRSYSLGMSAVTITSNDASGTSGAFQLNLLTNAVVAPATQTNFWGATASFNASSGDIPPLTVGWMQGSIPIINSPHFSGADTSTLVVSNLTQSDAGNYTVFVTNSLGGVTRSTGSLILAVPPPVFTPTVVLNDGNAVLSFSSSNPFDTTNAFILQTSLTAAGPFTDTTASFATNGVGFKATVPRATGNAFYRLRHVN